jgi:hypothetical protein
MVRFEAEPEALPEPATVPRPRPASHAVRRPPLRDRFLRHVEQLVGDWAPTLREAFVRVLVFAVFLVVLGITLGPAVAAAGAVVGFLMFLVGRFRNGRAG